MLTVEIACRVFLSRFWLVINDKQKADQSLCLILQECGGGAAKGKSERGLVRTVDEARVNSSVVGLCIRPTSRARRIKRRTKRSRAWTFQKSVGF